MTTDSEPLVVPTRRGLYCPQGDFHIDPCQPVQTAVVTHGHGDHLRRGNARYILARPGIDIARLRLGGRPDVVAPEYGARLRLGATTISLHPAGHILGSAQVRIEYGGQVWVVSGDYKRQADPTCASLEPLECDVFVSEATFARPIYRWPPTSAVVAEIIAWWRDNRDRGVTSVLYCYALGKAQRLLAELAELTSDPVLVHASMTGLIDIYRRASVRMAATLPATTRNRRDSPGALVLAPPSAVDSPWARRLGAHSSGFCSGWMRLKGELGRRGYDRGFIISDHADWPALVATCLETKARRILLMHGKAAALCRHLSERDVEARTLATGERPAG